MRILVLCLAVAAGGCGERNTCARDPVFQRARGALAEANVAIKLERFAEANDALKTEIEVFGPTVEVPNMQDDTGLNLAMAERHERNGDIEHAARMRRSVLHSRIDVYRWAVCGRRGRARL